MPYTILALKWRPEKFDDIVGQNHVVRILKGALENKRLANAYIFAGPRGVGKTSTARILAKALNCQAGPTPEPCGKCPACIDIGASRSLDVIEIDGASNRGIDEIRTLRESVKFAPVSGKFKIYIIDEVHMLTQEAFNALLKTLEEPPGFVKFIFATTQPNKVIPTILSRCQRLDFRRIPLIEIIAQLEKIVQAEKIKIDKDVLFAIARASEGSLRDAESILDQLSSLTGERILLKDVISVLGLIEQDVLFDITDRIIQKDAKGALTIFNNVIDDGKDINVFLVSLIEHFRNLMIAKVSHSPLKLIDVPEDICEKIVKQAQGFSLEEIFSAFNILIGAQEMSKRLESGRIPLEISLVRLTQSKKSSVSYTPERQADNPAHKNIEKNQSDPAMDKKDNPPISQGQGQIISDTRTVSIDELKESWHKVIDGLSRIKMSLASYLNEGNLVKVENNVITVAFPKDYSLHKESLESKDNKVIIEKLISELFDNVKLRLNFILTKETAQKNNEDNPLIRSALDMFGGRVIREE